MITDDRLPDWPPPPGEKIGVERARAYIAWIREHAPPLVAYGRQCLNERYPGKPTQTISASVQQLAAWGLDERMDSLNVGDVFCERITGSYAWMNINLRRDGRLECRPGIGMRS